MNTRRKFLLQGSMATTALLIADPFKTFANRISPITGFVVDDNKIVLLHTGNSSQHNRHFAAEQISSLKKSTGNLVLLHAGKHNESNTVFNNHDALIHTDSIDASQYKIIYKGDIKIGIIKAIEPETGLANNINKLSSYLKKEKKCQLVICLSQLGYKNKYTLDDLKLANISTHLDIIIGGHENNFSKHPMIAQNGNKEEVIIHAAACNSFALGNIEIGFDKMRNKHSIAFDNLLSKTA